MRRVTRRPLHLLALAMTLVVTTSADVIFHLPEVLVRHAAVPRPVGTRGSGAPPAPPAPLPVPAPRNESHPWPQGDSVQQRYDYFVDHTISPSDAKKMATMLKLSEVPGLTAGCGRCTQRDLEYCETKVLADHCCCERRFLPEPFPWLPHTCYIGPERCTPLAGDCAHYTRLRDCCCLTQLASHWKSLLSHSSSLSASGLALLLAAVALVAICL